MAKKMFSNPVVVTISLAELALAACTVKAGDTRPPNENPPPPIMDESGDGDAGDDDEAPVTDPGDTPPDVAPASTTTIQKRDDGTCMEVVQIDCPPGVMCNPPPPKDVPCPPDEPAGA